MPRASNSRKSQALIDFGPSSYLFMPFGQKRISTVESKVSGSGKVTSRPEYHGYQGTLILRLRWPKENRVAVTGTTESVSPLQQIVKQKINSKSQ